MPGAASLAFLASPEPSPASNLQLHCRRHPRPAKTSHRPARLPGDTASSLQPTIVAIAFVASAHRYRHNQHHHALKAIGPASCVSRSSILTRTEALRRSFQGLVVVWRLEKVDGAGAVGSASADERYLTRQIACLQSVALSGRLCRDCDANRVENDAMDGRERCGSKGRFMGVAGGKEGRIRRVRLRGEVEGAEWWILATVQVYME